MNPLIFFFKAIGSGGRYGLTGVSLPLVYVNGLARQVLECHRRGRRGHRGSLSFWLRLYAFLSMGQEAGH